MQDNKQHIIIHLYTSLVETRSLYKRRNKQHEQGLQLNSMSDISSNVPGNILDARTFAYTPTTLAHYLSQEECVHLCAWDNKWKQAAG